MHEAQETEAQVRQSVELLRRLPDWTGKPRSVSIMKEPTKSAVYAWPGVAVLIKNELRRASVVLDQNTIAVVEDDLRQLAAHAVLVRKAKAKLA